LQHAQQDTPYRWLFLDLNSFFASVEQNEDGGLRGKPTIVVPTQTDATCAIAASYEAKRLGIKTGTMVGDAKRLCPNLQIVVADHKKYVRYHHLILAEIERHLPVHKIYSIDELSCKLLGQERTYDAATALALKIKKGLWQNIGPAISCSIGLAPNAWLGKVATEMQKPDGLVALRKEDLPHKLSPLSLCDLPGIGARMEQRLHRTGITTIEQLYALQPKHARQIWGSVGGERFWLRLHGEEVPEEDTKRSMIGHSRVLPPRLRPLPLAHKVARSLAIKAARRMRREGYAAGKIMLSLKFETKDYFEHDSTLSSVADDFTLLEVLESLWRDIPPSLARQRVRKVSVLYVNLRPAGQRNQDLFPMVSEAARTRREKLTSAIDTLVDKYQSPDILKMGDLAETKKMHDFGTKIAFSRVPDEKEFLE